MQLELFTMEKDDRVSKMRCQLRHKIELNNLWMPTAKEIVAMGDKYQVVGALPLKIFIKEALNYCNELELEIENLEYDLNDFLDDVDKYEENIEELESLIGCYQVVIKFYRHKLIGSGNE